MKKLQKFKNEFVEDFRPLYEILSYLHKELTREHLYIITAVNGSMILQQKITKSEYKSRIYLKQLKDKWGEDKVWFNHKRID